MPVKDDRFTPRSLVEKLHYIFNFTVDGAGHPSAPATSIIPRIWTPKDNGLEQPWAYEMVFLNPPYSKIEPWIYRASVEKQATGCVILLPNWTDRKWWSNLVEPFRDRPDGYIRTRFLPRVQFGTPEKPEGAKWKSTMPYGMVLLQFDHSSSPQWKLDQLKLD